MTEPVTISRIEARVYRAPLVTPRRNAFGVMTERSAFLVRVEASDGSVGWGEGFSNWPAFGAEYRARFVMEMLSPLITGQTITTPQALMKQMTRGLKSIRIQCGDHGAIDQAIAAVDIAIWDLVARRAGKPLHAMLGTTGQTRLTCYASALTASTQADLMPAARAMGIRHFKLKVGFGTDADRQALGDLVALAGDGAGLTVDANQAWSADDAAARIGELTEITPLNWVEEPIAADSAPSVWRSLGRIASAPLAAGENFWGPAAFDPYIDNRCIRVLQPDIIKWGGLSGMLQLGNAINAAGLRFCPHYLGGGVGLMATAHLMAALGGDGLLELDLTENPFRDQLGSPFSLIHDGDMTLPDTAGHGVDPDNCDIEAFRVF